MGSKVNYSPLWTLGRAAGGDSHRPTDMMWRSRELLALISKEHGGQGEFLTLRAKVMRSGLRKIPCSRRTAW
jgi:hypothetical protein